MITTAGLQMRLLGHPEIRRQGRLVKLPTRKALLLLARLAVEGAQTRELLATLLWPESDRERGRTSLRRTLAYVRDSCGRDLEVVVATGSGVSLGPEAATDLAVMLRGLQPSAGFADLEAAVAAWRGEFLEGMHGDGEELDSWLGSQRATWQQRGAEVCRRLLQARSEAADTAGALAAADHWLERDPVAEMAHTERIRVYLMRGDRSAALEAYQVCAQVLASELGVRPSKDTEELAQMARGAVETSPARRREPRPEVPMVGREREHSALATAFQRAAGSAPAMVLLSGEAGIGKSRLVSEFAAWAATQGAQVRMVRPFPSGRRLAYAAVADALGEALISPLEGGAGAERQLFETVAAFLAGLAVRSTLVLVVDDLQWLDPDSLEVLLHAASHLARSTARFLLIVVARDDELSASSTLQDWMDRAGRELRLSELSVGPLSAADSVRLVEMWPEQVGGSAEQVIAQAGGRPLLLVESLRFLADGGDPATIAPAARRALTARLRTLSEPARRLARAAAVLEKPASAPALAKVADLDQAAATEPLDELLGRHVLTGEGQYSYSHELLRRAAYNSESPESRRALHSAAARVLDDLPGASPAEMAHHAEMAGELDLAWTKRIEAGRAAMGLPAYRSAVDQFRAALAIRPDPGPVWLELGRAEELSGRSDLAAGTYRMLADRARRSGSPADEASAMVRLLELAGRDLKSPPPEDLSKEAQRAAREADAPELEAEAELAAAQVHAYRGELSVALLKLEAVRRRVARLKRPDLSARCLNLSAFVYQAQGRWTDALELSRRAADAYRRLGEVLMRLDSTGYEVTALAFLGDWRAGLSLARRALLEAERLGNPWQVANLSLGEAWALRDGGRLEEAGRSADRGAVAAQEAGFLPLQVLNASVAGRCRRERGDLEAAKEIHEQILAPARGVGSVARSVVAEELCADHAAAGDWEVAELFAEEAEANRGEMVMFSRLSLWIVAEARLRSGAAFGMPELPEGDRYGLVRLRTEATLAEYAGDPALAVTCRRQALAIAERLGLPLEAAELLRELEPDRS